MGATSSINITDLVNIKNVSLLVNRAYIPHDPVSELFRKSKYILVGVKEYLSKVPPTIDINLPVVGFKVHKSYVMWTKFPIRVNDYWSYLYGFILGSYAKRKKRKITSPIKLLIEPQIFRFLKKYVFKELGITYGIEKREHGRIRVIIHSPATLILRLWDIEKGYFPDFINHFKATEGYLNTNKLVVSDVQKFTAQVRFSNEILAKQILEILRKSNIHAKITKNAIQIYGKKNLTKLYDTFIIIHPRNASKLFFQKELKKRPFLRVVLSLLDADLRKTLYFISWKNTTSIRTIAKYLHIEEDKVKKLVTVLEKMGFCQILKGDFGDIVVYTPSAAKATILNTLKRRIESIKDIISTQSYEYYVCNNCGSIYSFSKASDMNFKCDICGTTLTRKELTIGVYKSLKGLLARLEKLVRKM
ncbi:MAG: hypothetical protein ACP6IS_06920 [Candidatus Asgardarchaeia archaeon]